MVAFTGYAFAACFYLGALLKPFFPRNVGFFVGREGLNLAAWPLPHGIAVLDAYFIPLSVLFGYLFTVGTTLLIRSLVRHFGKLKQKI